MVAEDVTITEEVQVVVSVAEEVQPHDVKAILHHEAKAVSEANVHHHLRHVKADSAVHRQDVKVDFHLKGQAARHAKDHHNVRQEGRKASAIRLNQKGQGKANSFC